MMGRSREIVDLVQRRKVNVLCTQETRWKGAKAREVGERYKFYYYGVENGRNGIGIILEKELEELVVEVNRISDQIMWMRLQLNGEIAKILSVYAPQVGCTEQEKDEFWKLLDETVGKIPCNERVWIGGDLNEHVGEGNTGEEVFVGCFRLGVRIAEGN